MKDVMIIFGNNKLSYIQRKFSQGGKLSLWLPSYHSELNKVLVNTLLKYPHIKLLHSGQAVLKIMSWSCTQPRYQHPTALASTPGFHAAPVLSDQSPLPPAFGAQTKRNVLLLRKVILL